MNLQQLHYVSEIARHGLNISAVASILDTNQPGISKQVKAMEVELGVEIFLRSRNRLSGVTPHGQKIIDLAREILNAVANIRAIGADASQPAIGSIAIAVTETQARYVLPEIMKRFSERHPKVRITLRHANPSRILELLLAGEVDMGVTAGDPPKMRELIVLPFRRFERVIIVPRGHKLLNTNRVTLKELVRYPIVTYEPGYAARGQLIKAFEKEGLEPNVAVGAADADVIKTCVEQGLGVTVLSAVTFDPQRDSGLRAIPANHLFEPFSTKILLSRQHYLRQYAYDFIEMCAPRWGRTSIERLAGRKVSAKLK